MECNITQDDELLPQHAFRLEPMRAASRFVGQIRALRHDAFEAQTASMLEDGRTILLDEMLTEANGRVSRQRADDLRKQRFAVQQRCFRQIKPLAVKEIEHVVAEAVLSAGFQVRLQVIETRYAGRVFDDDLPLLEGRPSPRSGQPSWPTTN